MEGYQISIFYLIDYRLPSKVYSQLIATDHVAFPGTLNCKIWQGIDIPFN